MLNASPTTPQRKNRRRSSTLGSAASTANTGSSKTKIRKRISQAKKALLLGTYAILMVYSVIRMMEEQLSLSFWLDLSAFGLLWIYFVLSSQRLLRFLKIPPPWFYSHLMVLLAHLAVWVLVGNPEENPSVQKPVYQDETPQSAPQPYSNSGD